MLFIPSDRSRAEPFGALLLELSIFSRPPFTPTDDLYVLGAAAKSRYGDSAASYSHADWERGQPRNPACYVAIQYILHGQYWSCPPTS